MLTCTTATPALAGGFLTNTNQSIDFLRNPARDAAISLDGVYSNPAGVAFLPEGFYLGLNWMYAHQTRVTTSTDDVFALGAKNGNNKTKTFEGVADAPFIPSIQAAWNKGNWSLQLNLSVPGGGGTYTYDNGLGSFEREVGKIGVKLATMGAMGYDMNSFVEGRQYYYGLQIGSAYKVNDKLSVYGGLRLLYGDATYQARISNIMVQTAGGFVAFGSFLSQATATIDGNISQAQAGITQLQAGIAPYEAAGAPAPAELTTQLATLQATVAQLQAGRSSINELQKYSQGVNLMCNQSGLGVAPIVGVDYRLNDHFNFAAKYEFKTQMKMKNESTLFDAGMIDAVNKYKDGEKVNEDTPAQLAVGAQYSPIGEVRLSAGWHHYFDKHAQWYNNAQDKLSHDSNEFLAGAEWDVTDWVTISLGGQLTRYGLTDEYMNDMSFVVNSYSVGFGMNFKVRNNVTIKAGYFQTDYEDYDRQQPTIDSFTRTSRVFGLGCDIKL